MKLALISCGRSDFNIYLPLIKAINSDDYFDLDLIAFGTHNSSFYGNTINMFYEHGLKVKHTIDSLILGDSPQAISDSIGMTIVKFSTIWSQSNYDAIIVLGDRYEMFAAITASVPFNIPVAHISGGDTTLGAMDDIFRHSLSHMATLHFTNSDSSTRRLEQIIGDKSNIYNVGIISLEKILEIETFTKVELFRKYGIDFSIPTALITVHPDTKKPEMNKRYMQEIYNALEKSHIQGLITVPNNDTYGTYIRDSFTQLVKNYPERFVIHEALGEKGYYSCLKHCSFLLGNSSSGITEAASFKKYVINIGDRQKGRFSNDNVLNVPIKADLIYEAIKSVQQKSEYMGGNMYQKSGSVLKVKDVLKKFHKAK